MVTTPRNYLAIIVATLSTLTSAFHLPSSRTTTINNNNSHVKFQFPLTRQPSLPYYYRSINNGSSSTSSINNNLNNHITTLHMSKKEDEANEREQFMAQQKSEAYHALSSFHETTASFLSASKAASGGGGTSATTSMPSSFQNVVQELGSLMSNAEQQMMGGGGGGNTALNMANYWECTKGATVYLVPMDPAAGLKRGVSSKPYKSTVQVEMDLDGILYGSSRRSRKRGGGGGGTTASRQLRLRETFQFMDQDGNNSQFSIPFTRSVVLGPNVDVDSVDGSYSLDDRVLEEDDDDEGEEDETLSTPSLPLIPPSLLANRMDPSKVKFLVEHTLVVSEMERCRCFLMYGEADGGMMMAVGKSDNGEGGAGADRNGDEELERNYRLLGMILAEERKVMPEKEESQQQQEEELLPTTGNNDDDDDNDNAFNVSAAALELFDTKSDEQKKEEQMKRLFETIERHNKQVLKDAAAAEEASTAANASMEDSADTAFVRHNIGLYGITSGVFLGDAIIREPIPSKRQLSRIKEERQGKGFGKKAANTSSSSSSSSSKRGKDSLRGILGEDEDIGQDGFANWNTGVQKVSLQYSWDYSNSIMQSYEWGRSLGTYTSMACGENYKSIGSIVLNESKRLANKKGEEPRVIMDMNGGTYVAGLIGSTYFRAPRYMSFSRVRSYNHEPFLTEFMTFYRLPENSPSIPTSLSGDVIEGPGYYCSRMSRLYNSHDGSLLQGSTAFFTMSRPMSDSAEAQIEST